MDFITQLPPSKSVHGLSAFLTLSSSSSTVFQNSLFTSLHVEIGLRSISLTFSTPFSSASLAPLRVSSPIVGRCSLRRTGES